jgi:hypothetical protein
MSLPKHHSLLNPVLDAIRALGGSASIAELDDRVTQDLALPEEDVSAHTRVVPKLSWNTGSPGPI